MSSVLGSDSTTIVPSYDTTGRVSTLAYGGTTLTYGYNATSGTLTSITSTTGENLAYGFDGAVHHTYDTDFRVASESINIVATIGSCVLLFFIIGNARCEGRA